MLQKDHSIWCDELFSYDVYMKRRNKIIKKKLHICEIRNVNERDVDCGRCEIARRCIISHEIKYEKEICAQPLHEWNYVHSLNCMFTCDSWFFTYISAHSDLLIHFSFLSEKERFFLSHFHLWVMQNRTIENNIIFFKYLEFV